MAICPRTKKECPKTNKGKKGCEFWMVPGEGPCRNMKVHDLFPAAGMCKDHIQVLMLWDANCNIIGTQQATESFRNGMIAVGKDGKTRPRVDPVSGMLLKMLVKGQSILLDKEDVKLIEGE